MTIEKIFSDKGLKSKAKTELLSDLIQNGKIKIDILISFAEKSKDSFDKLKKTFLAYHMNLMISIVFIIIFSK